MRRLLVLSAAAAAVALVVVSPFLGRADVSGQYRPLLPPDGLASGCYPLPGGVVPEFAYVLRRDGDMLSVDGLRRRAVLHYDRVSGAEATAVLEQQLAAAGVDEPVTITTEDFDVPADSVVRGEMVLDLPVVARQRDEPTCRDANSTKRFAPDLVDRS
ncbi:hypothetical protein [Nocardioides litoris]|uniref:hypothetical protein n=1 Tax=Nocardioides litoris TaxID=1926648 RepID=UPI00111FFFA3|nr:hypothetical protein [Nocardioides litoris]